jgi:hypothetical protein
MLGLGAAARRLLEATMPIAIHWVIAPSTLLVFIFVSVSFRTSPNNLRRRSSFFPNNIQTDAQNDPQVFLPGLGHCRHPFSGRDDDDKRSLGEEMFAHGLPRSCLRSGKGNGRFRSSGPVASAKTERDFPVTFLPRSTSPRGIVSPRPCLNPTPRRNLSRC